MLTLAAVICSVASSSDGLNNVLLYSVTVSLGKIKRGMERHALQGVFEKKLERRPC